MFQNIFTLRRPRVANLADIVQIETMFIKTAFKDSKKVKRKNEKLYIKIQSAFVFIDITKIADFGWRNADVSRTQGMCHVICIFVGSSLCKI